MGAATTLALGGIGSSLIGGLTSLFGSKSQFKEQQKLINLQYQKTWNNGTEKMSITLLKRRWSVSVMLV